MTASKWKIQTWILLGLGLIAVFGWLTVIELRAEEPRRAVVSMEMVLSGNWDQPTLNGWPYYNKPPLFNWVMALVMLITGSFREWVVRIPSLAGFLGALVIIYYAVRKYLGQWPNAPYIIPPAVMATGEFLFLGTVNAGEIDLFYTFLVVGQAFAIFHFSQAGKWLALFAVSYAFAAAGMLTKGLPSLAFQVFMLVPWLTFNRQFRRLFSVQHLAGILLFILICGTGYLVYYRNGALDDFVVRQLSESSQRYGGDNGLAYLGQLVAYPGKLMIWLLPWSLLLPFWLFRSVRLELIRNDLVRFILIVLIFNLPFYWLSAFPKSRYIFMFLPWLVTLLCLGAMEANRQGVASRFLAMGKRVHFLWLAGVLVSVACLFVPDVQKLAGLPVRVGVLAILFFGFYLIQRRWHANSWFSIIGFLFVLRIGVNLIYLPYNEEFNPKSQYRQNVAGLVETVDHSAIRFFGKPDQFNESVRMFGKDVLQGDFRYAALIPYQIPYYTGLYTGRIMHMDTTFTKGYWYLMEQRYVPHPSMIKDSIPDYWLNRKLYLVQYPADSDGKGE